ncbi:MAG TPA: alkaline phosphatase PhoX [Acidimicrobiia bacterium]|nr:alkaline phosphatase PhoX [Acidimicrobiia bacterium]
MTAPRIDRRTLLRAGAGLGLAMATGPLDVLGLFGGLARADAAPMAPKRAPDNGGYGPLKPAGPVLELPDGFRYIRFGEEGSPMTGGGRTPPFHDGMAAFPGGPGIIRLVRNHEVSDVGNAFARPAYDPVATGGTTTMVFDAREGRLLSTFPSLAGTFHNCAGGPTPWGSWLSCEEGTSGPKVGFKRYHGYVFEVPAKADGPVDPVPLRAMGRFVHEAVAVDPESGIVYETEDRPTAGFYRFVPNSPGSLHLGGRLQMLAIDGQPAYDTRTSQPVGVTLPVTWVDIEDPDPKDAGWNPLSVFNQGLGLGGAIFGRLEGCCWDQGRVLLTATNGGDAACGQVWEYQPQQDGRGRLRLVFESPGPQFLRQPDNVVVSPRGGVLLCEDHDGADRLVGLDPEGRVFDFARNRLSPGEFAGLTYGPAIGYWLFVNIQNPGMTLAITGPWERGCL